MAKTATKPQGPISESGPNSGTAVPVYDADAHIAEPPSVWQEYADPEFRDLVMQCRIETAASADAAAAGNGSASAGSTAAADAAVKVDAAFAEGKKLSNGIAPACIPDSYGTKVTWDDIVPGSYDPKERLKVMDAEGLAAALMFPSLYLLSGDIVDGAIAAASARAYNRWMADFVLENPQRLFGMGVCPLQSPEESVAVIAECADAGMVGVTFRPERYSGMELFSPEMERVWSAAEDHDLTVGIHGSFGSRMPSFAKTRYDNQFFVHMVCHPFEQMASVMEIVASGILDDHPKLRVGFFESGLGWLPYWLERLDEHKEAMPHLVPRLKRSPTEIFSAQCFVTMEAGEGEAFEQVAEMGLAHTVVWGSDYPHYDCTYPGALAELDDTFGGFSGENHRALRDEVVYTNARRFMGMD